MDAKEFAGLFPLGSHLCREPMPLMSELKRDMELLARAGFNLVKLQEHWMIDEPREGACDFSRYEELIDAAARLDLGVYLGFTCEQAPHWLYEKHPDCHMVTRDGRPVIYEAQATLPADGKPGPCYDHPGARDDMLRFMRKAVETLGRFENVIVWNTWQEIGYGGDKFADGEVCYCQNTLTAWREWLQRRYRDLDGLNRAWNTRYARWEDIQPDRCGIIGPEIQRLAFRHFMDVEQPARVLRARAETIRDADAEDRPIFAHLSGPIVGRGAEWTYARCQDHLGTSCYPAWGSLHPWDDRQGADEPERHEAVLGEMWSNLALKLDYVRSANVEGSPVWAAEFQGGPVNTGFHRGRVPDAEDIRRWMLTTVASGVTGISFWVTRAEIMAAECNGFSLLDSVGDTTERFAEASRVGRALGKHPDLFAAATLVRPSVALVVDDWNYQLCNAMGNAAGHLGYDLRGWHRLMWDAGVGADFVELSVLDEGVMERYHTLVCPLPLLMSEDGAGRLAAHVHRGGNLICEAGIGRIDQHGFCNRGELSPRAAELFGVRQETYRMVAEPDGDRRWSVRPRTWGEFLPPTMLNGTGELAGQSVRANVYVETYEPTDSQPCLTYGEETAGVVRRIEGGSAWLLGTYIGHSGTAHRGAETRRCIRQLMELCGVRPPAGGRLLLRRRVAPGKEARMFTNPHREPVSEQVDVSGWSNVSDLLGEDLSRDGDTVTLAVQPLDVRVLILQR